MKKHLAAVVAALGLAGPDLGCADTVFAAWNIAGGEQGPPALRANAEAMHADVGPIGVLVLQEVISTAQVEAIAEGLGLEHWAISDFSPPPDITGAWFNSLEVAILSALPIEAAAEWDATGSEANGDGYPPRVSSSALTPEELNVHPAISDGRPARGFLRVDLEGGWSVFAVHWKSSLGQACGPADLAFARQREVQAAGAASGAGDALAEGRSVIIAGDYNIQAPGRALRVGTGPEEDCSPEGTCEGICGQATQDGYDDSIHMLLTIGHGARLLSADLPHTYLRGSYGGGAIDHLLVAGPRAADFGAAVTPEAQGTNYFGSDHRPAIAVVPEK